MFRVYYVLYLGGCVFVIFYYHTRSLHLVWDDSPLWPTYCRGQSMNFILHTPLFCSFVLGVSLWCWLFWRLFRCECPWKFSQLVVASCPKNVNYIFCWWVFSLALSQFVTMLFLFSFLFYGLIWYWFCCSVHFPILFSVFLCFSQCVLNLLIR
jgi:hypothetical protein